MLAWRCARARARRTIQSTRCRSAFGYSGTQLISITTPDTQATHTWTPGYDGQGRVSGVTSPVSGSVGQAGYTPSYTTQYSYTPGQTVVVHGNGTSGALTTKLSQIIGDAVVQSSVARS